MMEAQFRVFESQPIFIRQAVARVLLGAAGNLAGGFDRAHDRVFTQVRARGVAAPLAKVGGNRQALILLVFDGLKFAEPHRDRQALTAVQRNCCSGGPLLTGLVQCSLNARLQILN